MGMNYEQVIDLDLVTLDECIELFEKKHTTTLINDGHIRNFIVEDIRCQYLQENRLPVKIPLKTN